MSTAQLAAMMLGDESYAGSKSWKKFEATVQHHNQKNTKPGTGIVLGILR